MDLYTYLPMQFASFFISLYFPLSTHNNIMTSSYVCYLFFFFFFGFLTISMSPGLTGASASYPSSPYSSCVYCILSCSPQSFDWSFYFDFELLPWFVDPYRRMIRFIKVSLAACEACPSNTKPYRHPIPTTTNTPFRS